MVRTTWFDLNAGARGIGEIVAEHANQTYSTSSSQRSRPGKKIINNFEYNKIDEDEVVFRLHAHSALRRAHKVNGMLSSRLLAGDVDDDDNDGGGQHQKQKNKNEIMAACWARVMFFVPFSFLCVVFGGVAGLRSQND